MRVFLLVLAFCLCFPGASAQTQARRVALVIGIQNYPVGAAQLARPREDARVVHAALVAAGFDAGEGPLFDLDLAGMQEALRAFRTRAQGAEAAVLYFAGHGVEAGNETWLVPANARLRVEDDIFTEATRLRDVVQFTMGGARLRIVFLDACRNNPWVEQWGRAREGGAGGLPAIANPPEGVVIAYAAAARHTAPDDGVYAQRLAARIAEEGVELRQMLSRVASDVRAQRNLPAELAPINTVQLADTNVFYFSPSRTPTPPRATVAAARAFVERAEGEASRASGASARAAWTYFSNITAETERLSSEADAEVGRLSFQLAEQATGFAHLILDPTLRRKLDRLRQVDRIPRPRDSALNQEMDVVAQRLSTAYSSARAQVGGASHYLDQLEVQMRSERDPARLAEIWTSWHDTARGRARDYARWVELANTGARDTGFADLSEVWMSSYDAPPDQLRGDAERVWSQVRPLYEQLHCHVRAELNELYGDRVVPQGQPIRADLLGNMWAQEWTALDGIAGPPRTAPAYDLSALLRAQNYDARGIVRAGERFYTSLGLRPLPDTFWQRSQFERPRDRSAVCAGSAWMLDPNDVRLLMCIQPNEDDFRRVHHELGHSFYQLAYSRQDHLFQDAPNDALHEALGDFAALNVTPDYLVRIELLPADQMPSDEADLSLLMTTALDKIPLLPWAYLVDQWRWRVLSGEIAPADYNSAWWELRTRIQGVRPPAPRPPDAFDPGAKYHVANHVPYLRYFLSYILQFQLYQAACQQAGWQGPLHRCTVYGNENVGRRLQAMMTLGASRPSQDVLEAFTGSREMDGTALVAYFQPLMTWLQRENSGRRCGWSN